MELTADRLRNSFEYDAETGEFRRWGRRVGHLNDSGYIDIRIDGRNYRAHRLAWLYVHGEWPKGGLDHINTEKDDNRIENLREATHAQNSCNKDVPRKRSSLPKGVFRAGNGRFHAAIKTPEKRHFLGSFRTLKGARNAYNRAAAKLHGEFAFFA